VALTGCAIRTIDAAAADAPAPVAKRAAAALRRPSSKLGHHHRRSEANAAVER
jgi:hypothetical protein